MDRRPILLGLCDTRPPDQRAGGPLFPSPGSAGWRLWQLIRKEKPDVTAEDFCAVFDRRNVLDAQQWDWEKALMRAAFLRMDFAGCTVICLGTEVRKALNLHAVHDFGPLVVDGATYFVIPHPSRRCRWYNEPENRARVGKFLAEFF